MELWKQGGMCFKQHLATKVCFVCADAGVIVKVLLAGEMDVCRCSIGGTWHTWEGDSKGHEQRGSSWKRACRRGSWRA
jgi:hypothetical protein